MTKRVEQQLELFRVRSSRPPGREGVFGKPKGLSKYDEVKGVCPESEPQPRDRIECEGADSLEKDAGNTVTRTNDERVSGLPGSQTASSPTEVMEQPGGGPRLLGDELPEYPQATPLGSPGDGQPSGMGDGLALKRGNARGVKAPTHPNSSQEKHRRYTESEYTVETDLRRIRAEIPEIGCEEPDVGKSACPVL